MNTTLRRTGFDTPILSMIIGMGLLVGIPPALYILVTAWAGSPQRQLAAGIGIFTIAAFVLFRKKYEVLLLALIFFSQFQISLLSIELQKPALLQICFSDILIVFFLMAAIERRERFRPDLIGWTFLALVTWQSIAVVFFSAHLHKSAAYLLFQFKCLALYLFIRHFPLTEAIARKVANVVFIVLLIQGILGIAQMVTGRPLGLVVFGEQSASRLFFVEGGLRVSGTLGATNAYAGYASMLLAFCVPFLFRRLRSFQISGFGVGFASLLFALSRAGWLSFFVGAAVAVSRLLRLRLVHWGRVTVVLAGGVILIGVGALLYHDRIEQRFEDKDAVDSAMGRFYQFDQAKSVIQKYPLFGIGAGVTEYFGAWKDNQRYIRASLPGVSLSNQPHSSQLQYWVESGAPGFGIFIFLTSLIVVNAVRGNEDRNASPTLVTLRIGCGAACLAAMVHASFGTEINHYQIMLMFWILLAISRTKGEAHAHNSRSETA